MRIVMAAINAKFMHTNLALRSIGEYVKGRSGLEAKLLEYTINQRAAYILEQLYLEQADVYMFSCYIWNISMVCSIAAELRKLVPCAVIAAGGPQVSYNCGDFLLSNPAFDLVLAGEGEISCLELLKALDKNEGFEACPGICYIKDGVAIENPPPSPMDINTLPFPYPDLGSFDNRILYYESMRGCPFSCSYCLSSVEKGLRIKSIEIVQADLKRFLDAGVRQVKFVDRTFNCDENYALSVWEFLSRHDNGITNFHFELSGELLSDDAISFLSGIRPGLFQFEIGVQSTNAQTLKEIQRPGNIPLLFSNVRKLKEAGNIHLHLDLIAGLPHENMDSFISSFNQVYALKPHQLQLGFLKVLSGSAMEDNAEGYGLVFENNPPYEILFNRWLTYSQLLKLKGVADMVESYYNSGRFSSLIRYMEKHFETAFDMYSRLAEFFEARGCKEAPPGKTGYYELLGEFMTYSGIDNGFIPQWLCRYDMARHEKIRTLPGWVKADGSLPFRERILDFYAVEDNICKYLPELSGYQPKQILRMAHIEVFPFNPDNGDVGEYPLLFNYNKRDVDGKAACTPIKL